jgi:TolB-like protein
MPNKISQFWQELKRRNVVRVVTVYAGAAFVIIELINNITEPLRLPEWTPTLVIVLLAIGFPIMAIFSWIYDIHPEGGIVKTEPVEQLNAGNIHGSSNGWKIASYISFVVIIGLILLNIIPRSGKKEFLEKSIAVLPFESLSEDKNLQYQADGVMDAILLNLSKIEDLRVISRTSVEQYRDTKKTISGICEEMGVSYVLEGSFQKSGNQIRLIVQLIRAGMEGHIWANQYDREWKDIFSVQSEIAQLVAGEIQAVITPEERELIEKVPTTSLTAYDFYQKGREEYWRAYLNIYNNASFERPEYFFNKALEYDPDYALAYSGLALVQYSKYMIKTGLGANYKADYFQSEKLDSVNLFSDKALAIDNRVADAFYAKGCYEYEKGNLREALALMQKALAIDPNHTAAMTEASDISAALFDYVTALELLYKAASLERGSMLALVDFQLFYTYYKIGFPEQSLHYLNDYLSFTGDSLLYYFWQFYTSYIEGNFQEAFEWAKDAYAIDSTDRDQILLMGMGLLNLKRYEEAFPYFSRYRKLSEASNDFNVNYMKQMGYLLWMIGREEEAMLFFHELIDHCTRQIQIQSDYGQSAAIFDKASIYSFLGEKDSAYYYLENLIKVRWHKWYISRMKNISPMLEPIRNEERFQQLLNEMESKYQAEHERVRQWQEDNDML